MAYFHEDKDNFLVKALKLADFYGRPI